MAASVAVTQDHVEAERGLGQHAQAHLRRAEYEIVWLRWFGMAAWALILLTSESAIGNSRAWLVFAGGFAYAIWAHWRIDHTASIRLAARTTSICDPLLAASMCAVTGGIESLFYPFFYFTLLATAFRFGTREAAVMLAIDIGLSALLYLGASAPGASPVDLAIAILYLVYSTLLGAMMARWAQQNLSLAESRGRDFRHARDQTRLLLQRLVSAQEGERRLMAGDLHDQLGHHLFVLKQGLDMLAEDATIGAGAQERLKSLRQEAQACTDDVRSMMNTLRPTVLDDFGFCEAVRDSVARLKGDVPFRIELNLVDALAPQRPEEQSMLFRIVQESLLNIRKHASATRVEVSLLKSPGNEAEVKLTIKDDGKGFDPSITEPGHLGLLSMRERALALGGSLEISTTSGGGTTITVSLPERRPA